MDLNTVGIINTLGLVSTLGGFLYVGRKLQILDDVKHTVDIMKHNLKVVCDHLIKYDKDFDHTELKSYSPFKLTTAGNKLVQELQFDQTVTDNKQAFYGFIEAEGVGLKYDVEKAAIKSIYALIDESYMQSIKIFLYNKADRAIQNVAPTLGVYVRDRYLADHPQITK